MESTMPDVPLPQRPPPPRTLADRIRDWITWFGAGRLAVGVVSAATVVAVGFWLLRAPPPPVETTLPMATAASSLPVASSPSGSTTTTAPASTEIVVHVAGAVNEPGVRTLPPGARVVDAVSSAGGLAPDAAPDALNLAARLHDGDRVYVPWEDDPAEIPIGVTPTTGATDGSGEHAAPVSVNSAGVAELEELPGVGPSIASAIVAYRDEHGPFLSVDDLTEVAGIGPAKLEALRDLVTV